MYNFTRAFIQTYILYIPDLNPKLKCNSNSNSNPNAVSPDIPLTIKTSV